MARGSKARYTDKQKRQAEHIAEGYRKRGTPANEAKRRAWATVNDQDGGGKKSGSGRGKPRKTSVKDPGRGPSARTSAPKSARKTARKSTSGATRKTARRRTTRKKS
jgi:plasmid stabilization system protein ParE